MRRWVNIIIGFLTLLYPLAVYFGLQYVKPWQIAILLFLFLFMRLMLIQADNKWYRVLLLFACFYCVLAIWNNDLITLRFYPVMMSLGMFILFFSSLFFPPPIVERIARIQHPDLPQQGVIYTRKVTRVWCVFFVINGSIALVTALWSSFAWWSLYNGLIAYLLMGLLMGIEYLVRIKTQPHAR